MTSLELFSRIGIMQTFLPEADFQDTAEHLDRKRLIKQSVENLQILKSLAGMYSSGAWSNHPAVKMWRGHEDCCSCTMKLSLRI